MSKVLDRVKNIFKRNPRPPQLPHGSYPYNPGDEENLGTITKPTYQSDDDDEEIESVRNYNVPEQTRLREQARNTFQSGNISQNQGSYASGSTLPSAGLNPPNASVRGGSSGFAPGLPMNNNFNNNINPPPNNNTGIVPNLPSRPGLPFLSQVQDPSSRPIPNPAFTSTNNPQPSFGGFPSGPNQNQSAPPPSNNPQPSFGGFPPGMNQNQSAPPPPNNPPPYFGGFPPGMNQNQSAPPLPNNPQSSFGGFPPGANPNPSVPPPPNSSQPSFGGFPPGMNQNQPIPLPPPPPPPPPNNSQPLLSGVSPGMNTNQTSPPSAPPNPQSGLAGLSPGMNPQSLPSTSISRMNASNNQMNAQQGSSTHPISSFQNQSNDNDDNISRLELDYPIENVLIDANIPSAMAIKINDVVEQDRLGHAYHIHRYTFEPSAPQQISLSNNQHLSRHSVQNPYHGGTRHIREVDNDHQNSLSNDIYHPQRFNKYHRRRHHHYSDTSLNQYIDQLLHTPGTTVIQANNSNDLHHILNQHLSNNHIIPSLSSSSISPFQPNTNTFTEPIFYYTARALSYDPMRNY